jgi:hypothetical protein
LLGEGDSFDEKYDTLRNFTWEKHCGGLVVLPVAA